MDIEQNEPNAENELMENPVLEQNLNEGLIEYAVSEQKCKINCEPSKSSSEEDIHNQISKQNFIQNVKILRNKKFPIPETVSILECTNGTKVYLVGTSHFSQESINDVKNVVENINPDVVVIELCRLRSHSVILTEDEIKNQITESRKAGFIKNFRQSNNLLQFLLSRLSAYLMDEIGMAPGGEFRAAYQWVSKQPHCHFVLGDRSVNVTLRRAIDSLSIWKKMMIFFTLLFKFESITKDEIEAMKKDDLLEKLVKELAGDYPELTRVILEERDMYLTRSIWNVCGNMEADTSDVGKLYAGNNDSRVAQRSISSSEDEQNITNNVQTCNVESEQSNFPFTTVNDFRCCSDWVYQSELPRVVVAIVGIGHAAGIRKHWPTAESIDVSELMVIEPPSQSCKIIKGSVKLAFLSLSLYGAYWLFYGIYRTSFFCFKKVVDLGF